MAKRSAQFFLIIVSSLLLLISCVHHRAIREPALDQALSAVIPRQEVHMVYVPQMQRMPAHIVVTKTTRYQFLNNKNLSGFKQEIILNPLMHNISLVAEVQRGGKKVRSYQGSKSNQPVLSKDKSMWLLGRTKLALVVPYLEADEEVLVTTKYAWMETRWHEPIYMEGSDPTFSSKLTVDVPFGIKPHFIAADRGEVIELPETQDDNNPQWGQRDNRSGQTRYVFEREFQKNNTAKNPGQRLQFFFAFDAPSPNDKQVLFENWESISRYLYNRIDRYDLPSSAIGNFAHKECDDKDNDLSKIARIFSFLSHDIERRTGTMSFQEQEPQPATRTFTRRFGSPFDIVILGKAMFQSLGLNADIVAVSDPQSNPRIEKFYSPALFDRVILAVTSGSQSYYFDPNQEFVRLDHVPTTLQGQYALLLRPNDGQHFALPYEPPQKNQVSLNYDLNLNDMGMLQGSFSLDLTGARADHAKALVASPISALSAGALQNKVLYEDLALRWQKASLTPEAGLEGGISFSGVFSPRLLARSPQMGFVLPIKEIFEPVILPLIQASRQGYSSLSILEASLKLPENFKVAQVPYSLNIDQHGVTGRFLVTHEQGHLIFQGEAMVSLPVKPDAQAPLAMPEQHIVIGEMAAPEAPHGASTQN